MYLKTLLIAGTFNIFPDHVHQDRLVGWSSPAKGILWVRPFSEGTQASSGHGIRPVYGGSFMGHRSAFGGWALVSFFGLQALGWLYPCPMDPALKLLGLLGYS